MVVHVLAVYWIAVAPGLSWWSYRRDTARLRAGDPAFRFRLYRRVLIKQGVTIAAIAGLVVSGLVPGEMVGLRAPASWPWAIGLSVAAIVLLVWSARRMRPKAQMIREKMRDRGGAVLPESDAERRWFAAVSVGAGVSEELAYRGFMFFYLTAYVPRLNTLESVILTSVIFGVAHLYQGWRGIVASGISGLILACAFVLTGNLLLPMVLHAMGNLRGALIFRGQVSSRPQGSGL
jgi:membrane protease YdiL (CAAX protease family)